MKTGGHPNAENNERGFEKNQGNQSLSKGKSNNRREYGESAEAFRQRITKEGSGASGKTWSLVKGKKSQFAYISKVLKTRELPLILFLGSINTNGTNLNEGENNANQRTTEASVEEIRERFFKKPPDSIGGSLAETAESFAERTSRDSSAGSGRARILLNFGKLSMRIE